VITQVIKQVVKQVFLSQRNKGERSRAQSRQVVALRAKFDQILALSAKILALRALNRSPLFLCEKDFFLLACLIDRGELTPVAGTAEILPSPERPSVMTATATRPEGYSFRRLVLSRRSRLGAPTAVNRAGTKTRLAISVLPYVFVRMRLLPLLCLGLNLHVHQPTPALVRRRLRVNRQNRRASAGVVVGRSSRSS
jgi:hypothetical protein